MGTATSDNAQGLAAEKVTVDDATFLGVMAQYADTAFIVNAYVGAENKETFFTDLVSRAQAALAGLALLSESGKGYTPPESLGFGSDNASQIAKAITGQRLSNGKVRSTAAKVGRAVLARKSA